MTIRSTKETARRAKPELLAPAGNLRTFFAALEQGADAVYVGAHSFNARLRATNFSIDELARMVAYAHSIGRKVYVTLNTIVKETELPGLVQTLDELRRIAPDAFIVQDLGVCRLARRLAPEIPLHASTQMTIHNLDGALQAQRMGFSRIILAREMTLEEIGATRGGSEIELETFIHGAMCYSISGQCNFSSYAHGKSANRGRCAQPCRRAYETDKKLRPLFATLDLNTAPILAQLMAAGIHGFKIEGRLKPSETIAQTVAAYRVLIDAYPAITKDVVNEARNRLKLAVGREQSTGFYLSPTPPDSMVNEGTTQSGRFLGKVLRAEGESFDIETREVIKAGDRLNVQKHMHKPPRAFSVRDMYAGEKRIGRSRPNERITIMAPFEVEVGSTVVKLADADAVPEEAKRYDAKKWPHATACAKATFGGSLRFDWNGAVVVDAEVNGQRVSIEEWPSYETYLSVENAIAILNQDVEQATARLSVNGSADFPDGVPMSEGELAALRDKALAAVVETLDKARDAVLEELRLPLATMDADTESKGVESRAIVRVNTFADAVQVMTERDVDVALPLAETLDAEFGRLCHDAAKRERFVIALPTFEFEHGPARDTLVSTLKEAIQAGVRRFMVSNLAHFNLLRPYRKRRLFLIADDALHCMNSACVEALRELGVACAMFAQEGDRRTLEVLAKRVGGASLAVQAYGKVPLFRSRQPHPARVKEATATVGAQEVFQILRRDGLTYVVPRRDFSLRHHMADFKAMGIRAFVYDLTFGHHAVEHAGDILNETPALRPREETSMNFERGLD